MWLLPNHCLSMSFVGVIHGQDVFSIIRPLEDKSGRPRDLWAVQTDHYPEK